MFDDQSGAVAMWAAIALVVVMGMAALAVDIGRLAVTKSELQKAADAGALAGARGLSTGPPYPNWNAAQTKASATAQENQAAGSLIVTPQVEVGYWNLSWTETTAPANLKPIGSVPLAQDAPAVKVTITKDANQNLGPLAMLFAPLLGVNSTAVSAHTVACIILQPVNQVDPGQAFPLATPVTFVNQFIGQDPSTSFRIGSAYLDPTGGQWTSFLADVNDVPTIRWLINNGNPGPLQVGDQIWIEPGTKNTLYNEATNLIGRTVLLPVVPDGFDTHAESPIQGFVPFYIEDACSGADKYIQGHFVSNYTVPGGIGTSNTPDYGAKAGVPKLIN